MRSPLLLLHDHGANDPAHPALLSPDGHRLGYAALRDQIEIIGRTLRDQGITRGDTVAVAMPDGPALAAVLLGVMQAGICAPLNPAYREADLAHHLDDIAPRLAIVAQGAEAPLRAAAAARNVPVLEVATLAPGSDRVVQFGGRADSDSREPVDVPAANDIALLLHTSGTTSKPKMVPLTHGNLAQSACNVATALDLEPRDRCLNVMPLFHIHGLVGGLLASLAAGASVIAAPGFDAARVLRWASDAAATWYTAVPTLHQAVLDAAGRDPESAGAIGFRLIRSSSASLPPTLLSAMESRWGVPVIESYGMSEAAHQMTSNPLPPAARKAGSVGVAAGPDVAIMDDTGRLLAPHERGEVVIRGSNVMSGYRDNPGANARALGYFDDDGYLFLTGRLKEMINRGGEKIAPREIDEVLLEHPRVAQTVAFAVPHATLGEDLAAAVVLEPGTAPDDDLIDVQALRQFVAERLAGFKVPSRIVVVDAIPKGPTGKLQRIGLHHRLATQLEVSYAAPETDTERLVSDAFRDVLNVDRVGRDDNFFALGGDSVRGMAVVTALSSQFGRELSAALIFEFPTPALLGAEVDRQTALDADLDALADELANLPPDEIERLLGGC